MLLNDENMFWEMCWGELYTPKLYIIKHKKYDAIKRFSKQEVYEATVSKTLHTALQQIYIFVVLLNT